MISIVLSQLQKKYQDQQINIPLPEVCKLKIGIKNLGNTCYINAAIQAIKHMYLLEPQLLEMYNTEFSEQLKKFFISDNNAIDYSQLKLLVEISQDYQKHLPEGGDSYSTLINYLSILKKQIFNLNNPELLCKYNKIYNIYSEDGLQCVKCSNFCDQYDEIQIIKEYEENLILNSITELQNIDESIQSIYGKISAHLECPVCIEYTQFHTRRVIKQFPQFMIIRFLETLANDVQFPDIISFKFEKYKIIGYCTYINNHFFYTGKYGQEWITFNDNNVYLIKKPCLSLAFYILLEIQKEQ